MKKLKTKKIIGIDYSLTSPAVCVTNGSFDFEDCKFYYTTTKKKYEGQMAKNIIGYPTKPYNDDIERFKNLSDMVLETIGYVVNPEIYIEGYSFGSRGRALFQIAENGGILKYRLSKYKYTIIPPANVKKFATGKGNADKEKMYDQFYVDTGVNLMEMFEQNTLASPVSDIVDAYYIAKYGTTL